MEGCAFLRSQSELHVGREYKLRRRREAHTCRSCGFTCSKLQRKGLKCSLKLKGKMLQPAEEAPPPAPIPLPTEDDEAAAREAHPEAAAAQQRAYEAMVVAKRGEDLVAFGRARIAYLRHAPCEGLLAEFSELLSCVEEDDPNGRDYGRGAQALRELIDMVRPCLLYTSPSPRD